MIARTHNLIAFTSLVTAAVYYPPDKLTGVTLILALIANIVGSLLPDLDQESNRLWDLLPGGNKIGKILKNIFLSHRTLSHSILGMYLIYQISNWLLPQIFNAAYVDTKLILISLMIGYISHLVADGLTEEGLPLLFPLKIRFGFPPVKKWRIKSGKWFEKYVIFSGVAVYLIVLLFGNRQLLYKIIINLWKL